MCRLSQVPYSLFPRYSPVRVFHVFCPTPAYAIILSLEPVPLLPRVTSSFNVPMCASRDVQPSDDIRTCVAKKKSPRALAIFSSPSVTAHKCPYIGYDEFNPRSWPSACAPEKDDWMRTSGAICGTSSGMPNYPEEFWNCSDIKIEGLCWSNGLRDGGSG